MEQSEEEVFLDASVFVQPCISHDDRMAIRQRSSSDSPYEETIGFSRAVRVNDQVRVSGTAPIWTDGSCPDDVGEQARRCFEIIATALTQLGASLADVVRTRMF